MRFSANNDDMKKEVIIPGNGKNLEISLIAYMLEISLPPRFFNFSDAPDTVCTYLQLCDVVKHTWCTRYDV